MWGMRGNNVQGSGKCDRPSADRPARQVRHRVRRVPMMSVLAIFRTVPRRGS